MTRRNKFNAKQTMVDGMRFHSRAEARRWSELKLYQKGGLIERLERQVLYPLVVNGVRVSTYIADFVYHDLKANRWVVEDVKSPATARLADFKMKRSLMQAIYNIDLKVTA